MLEQNKLAKKLMELLNNLARIYYLLLIGDTL